MQKKNMPISNEFNISANASIYTKIGLNWSWDIGGGEGGVEYIPFLCVFTKYQVRNTPMLRFREIGFKIPIFLWNLEHTLDPKCSISVATGVWTDLVLSERVETQSWIKARGRVKERPLILIWGGGGRRINTLK